MEGLVVNTDKYLEGLMEEFSDKYDMNSEPEDTEPIRWLESRINQLDNNELYAITRLERAQGAGYLHWGDLSDAKDKYHKAYQERVIDAAYKCAEAMSKQRKERKTIVKVESPSQFRHLPEAGQRVSRGGGSFDMNPDDPNRPYDRPDGH